MAAYHIDPSKGRSLVNTTHHPLAAKTANEVANEVASNVANNIAKHPARQTGFRNVYSTWILSLVCLMASCSALPQGGMSHHDHYAGSTALAADVSAWEHQEDAYAHVVEARVRERGKALRAQAQQQQNTLTLKFVAVGAGPTNAIYLANRHFAWGEAAVLEASEYFGTFSKLEGTFRLNSTEEEERSGNLFVGSPVQVRQHNLTRTHNPSNTAMSRTVVDAYDFSQVAILTGEAVVSFAVQPADELWPARYRLETASGLQVFAGEVVFATGLGQPKLTPGSEELAHEKGIIDHSASLYAAERPVIDDVEATQVPLLQTADDLLERSKRRAQLGIDTLRGYAGKTIVVVGAGHGAMTALLHLLRKTPINEGSDGEAPAKIIWSGYKMIDNRAIYEPLMEAVTGNAVELQFHRVFALNESTDPVQGRQISASYKTTFSGKFGDLQADAVITAFGYESHIQQLFKPLGNAATWETIYGHLAPGTGIQKKVGLGKQLRVNTTLEKVAFIGMKAWDLSPSKDIAFKEEFQKRLGTVIELMAGRIAAFAQAWETYTPRLLRVKHGPRQMAVNLAQLPVRAEASGASAAQPYATGLELRKGLGRLLAGLRIDSPAAMLHITFERQGDELMISSQLGSKVDSHIDANVLCELIKADSELFQALISQVDGATPLTVGVPLVDGRAQLHFLQPAFLPSP